MCGQRIAIGVPARADDAPVLFVQSGKLRQEQAAGGADGFGADRRHQASGTPSKRARVDLAHARVDYCQDRRIDVVRRVVRERRERRHRYDRHIESQREPLRHRNGQAHASERTGTSANGDRIDLPPRDSSLAEQRFDHRQDQLGMTARRDLAALDDFIADEQSCRTGFRSGIESEQIRRLIIAFPFPCASRTRHHPNPPLPLNGGLQHRHATAA